MEQWATEKGMQEALALELLSYQMSKLDDTWQEATHKNVGQYCRTTPAAKIPRIAARQRLLQNLELHSSSARGRFDLRRFLPFWKAIDQTSHKKAWKLIAPRTKAAGVIARVYKSGDTCMVDWSTALRGQVFHDNVEAKVSPTTIARMQVEYLQALLKTGHVYSIPPAAGAASDSRTPFFPSCRRSCRQEENAAFI